MRNRIRLRFRNKWGMLVQPASPHIAARAIGRVFMLQMPQAEDQKRN